VKLRNADEVIAYLRTIPQDAPESRKWQAVRTATRAVLRSQSVPNVGQWAVEPLPPQAYSRYGDCNWNARRIRYRKQHVREWWPITLGHTIIHEAAHAITANEIRLQGKRGTGGHGPLWRGVMATMGLPQGRAHNLPSEEPDEEDVA
jgi:hypothetical protein